MGICEKSPIHKRKEEMNTGHKPVPIDIANLVIKSICKITIKLNNGKIINGTGFFMKISNSIKYLITNYHIINPNLINEKIEIEIWNHKTMKLNLNSYNITYFKIPKDITTIQINNSDEIFKDIEFLDYDRNYVNGYNIYLNADVFSIEHPFGKGAACASGTITNINNYEFDHNISTENGSSGCPIILLNDNIGLIQVIGIHKNAEYTKKINGGTFIGEIFKGLNKSDLLNNRIIYNEKEDNYIIAEIYIKENYVNKNVKIINSFEEDTRRRLKEKDNYSQEYWKKYFPDGKFNKDYMNEEEIKKCEIKINDELIPFDYYYKFQKKGNYKIK